MPDKKRDLNHIPKEGGRRRRPGILRSK